MTSKKFSEIDLPDTLSSGYSDPNEELFVPLLANAKTFDVAVGYFSSAWLRDVCEAILTFAAHKGKSRWVISPQLQKEDAEVISTVKAEEDDGSLQKLLDERIINEFFELDQPLQSLLATLIKYGVLEFKIALPKIASSGMFHAKIGNATDFFENKIAFTGSYNLTGNAKSNWEHIDVFKSWISVEKRRIDINRERFENLWKDIDPSYKVLTPSLNLISQISNKASSLEQLQSEANQTTSHITLRDYQLEAIQAWGEASGKGFLVMATGSGKTITALSIVQKFIKERTSPAKRKLFVCFILPLKHLLDQWFDEASNFGYSPIKCYESSDVWRSKLADALVTISAKREGIVMAMVTNSTFISDAFQTLIKPITGDFLIIADEAHNLGAPAYSSKLPNNADFRLALSATPMRHNDDEGTESLFNYFGKSVFEFSLADAIQKNFLVPYIYTPLLCEMTEQEFYLYQELSNQIEEQKKNRRPGQPRTQLHEKLLKQRNELISMVESKLDLLSQEIQSMDSKAHTLIYCGTHRDSEGLRHIDKVLKLVGKELGLKARKFTASESLEERQEILSFFASGDLEVIAAIKCLDEGVDVPATKNAFILSSTTNPREFIQRRGRVLRKAQGKTQAAIFDFIVIPPKHAAISPELVSREVFRGLEYNSLAINSKDNEDMLLELAKRHGVNFDE